MKKLKQKSLRRPKDKGEYDNEWLEEITKNDVVAIVDGRRGCGMSTMSSKPKHLNTTIT
ncbi:MAG: hypothetical protein HQ538_06305 [Parcubacteria group bacterium]|nr:hypothetical protein [Parcubacteria group bacterium]